MRRSRAQSGQVMPMVALLMITILGMAAFAVDGSNIYSQHRKLQADLDVAVKVAAAAMFDFNPTDAAYTDTARTAIADAAQILAGDGYANTLTSAASSSIGPSPSGVGFCGTDTSAGITICNPPQRGFFTGASHYAYVEGRLSQDVGGFFGGVLGLGRVHISVRAVAWHGGFHQPYAVIGLDPSPSDCSVAVQNTASNLTVTGSIMADAQSCVNNGTATVYGHSDASVPTDRSNGTQIIGYGGTNTGVPPVVDPYYPISPTVVLTPTTPITIGTPITAGGPITISGTFPITCQAETAALLGITTPMTNSYYYFSPSNGSAGNISSFDISKGSYYFLPGCNGTGTGVPGSFYFSNSPYDAHMSGTPTMNTINSVLIFDPSNYLLKDDGNAIWELRAPTSGPYQGIAMTEVNNPCIPTTGMDLTGNSGSFIEGVVDVPCANLTISGNSSENFISGAVVAYDVTVAGNSNEIVDYDPSGTPPDKGSVLVPE